jgi:hypothetical protein
VLADTCATAPNDTLEEVMDGNLQDCHRSSQVRHENELESAQGENLLICSMTFAMFPAGLHHQAFSSLCTVQVEIKTTKTQQDTGLLQKAADYVHAYLLGTIPSFALRPCEGECEGSVKAAAGSLTSQA